MGIDLVKEYTTIDRKGHYGCWRMNKHIPPNSMITHGYRNKAEENHANTTPPECPFSATVSHAYLPAPGSVMAMAPIFEPSVSPGM